MARYLEPLVVNVDGRVFPEFADLTRDYNPLHRSEKLARRSGFESTPAQGVMILFYFEEAALKNGLNPNRYLLSCEFPMYPNSRMEIVGEKSNTGAHFVASRLSGQVAYCDIVSEQQYYSNSGTELNFPYFVRKISEKDLSYFYSLLNLEKRDRIPVALVASTIPSYLMKMFETREEQANKGFFNWLKNFFGAKISNQGIFRKMDIKVFREPSLGEYKTKVFSRINPRNRDGKYIYSLDGVAFMDDVPIISANLKVVTHHKLH